MKILFACLITFTFIACVPASSGESDLSTQTPIYWLTPLSDFELFVVSFARNFDEKFVNAYVVSNLVNIHEIKLDRKPYLETDGKPYQLTIIVSERANSVSSFLLMNEQDVIDLEFPKETLAFRLNAALTQALDAKYKRQVN